MVLTKGILGRYVGNKLVSTRKSGDPALSDYEVACYTKHCFFSRDGWDSVTRNARGALLYKGVQVNHPFPKMFNIDEVSDAAMDLVLERMKCEDYHVFDKANGHLFIMNVIARTPRQFDIVYSTKGSLPSPDNELLNRDIQVFTELYGQFPGYMSSPEITRHNYTFLFEAIVEHDPHTLYEQQVQKYGAKNVFVLLAAYSQQEGDSHADSWERSSLQGISDRFGFPLIKEYDVKEVGLDTVAGIHRAATQLKDVEGFVIHFPSDDFRVKLKVNEYWRLRRMKEFTPRHVLDFWVRKGTEELRLRYPEEISNQVVSAIETTCTAYAELFVGLKVPEKYIVLSTSIPTKEWSRVLFSDETIPDDLKRFIKTYLQGGIPGLIRKLQTSTAREKFVGIIDERKFLQRLDIQLRTVFDGMEK